MRFIKLTNYLAALGLFLVAGSASAQTDSIKYNHLDVFGPITWPVTGDGTRSASGQPGEHYWQNRADYLIKASLNETPQDNHFIYQQQPR
jgi:hypothetical protein